MADTVPDWAKDASSNPAPDWASSVDKPSEPKPIAYGRGQLPIPGGTPMLPSKQDILNSTMVIPAIGAEGAALKGGELLENAATKAYPKVAQFFAEHPFIAQAPKVAAGGATGGAVFGAGTGNNIPLSAAVGAVGSTGAAGLAEAVPAVKEFIKKYLPNLSPDQIEEKAKQVIQSLQAKDVKGGGLSADEITKQVTEARKAGKPMIVPDVAGENLRGKAGTIARVPGVGKQQAQQFFKDRDEAAATRLSSDLDKYLGTGSAKDTIKKTAQQRSTLARPLFEKAYQGGSLAPLEKQYQTAWQAATKVSSDAAKDIPKIQTRITQIKAKMSQTENVYQQSSLRKELAKEEGKLSETTQNLATAKDDERLAKEAMNRAQTDRTTAAKGAVWSPKIQRFLANQEVKSGINRGMQIERNLADAAGHPFDVTEYATTGMDKEGNPIIGKVPNMKLLATAKEGLDARLLDKDIRDETTGRLTKLGLSIQKMRDSLREELVKLNPDYAKALDSWSGDSAIINATNYGKNIALKQPAEDIAEELSKMSPSEKEAARVGISDELKVRLSKATFNGDESKKILNSEYMKAQLKPFFKTEKDYNQFVKNVSTENKMFETPVVLKGKSPSQERAAVDAEDSGLQEAVGHAANRNWGKMLQWLKDRAANAGWKNQAINNEIAKLLFNPNIPADYLKADVKLGAPTQSIVRKAAPYVGSIGVQPLLSPSIGSSFGDMLKSNQ